MADKKISALTPASLPLAGSEVLPIVQGGVTVKVATDNLTAKNFRSNATNGILQVAGPGAGTTRVMTTPDANFSVARTDAAQTFSGDQTFSSGLYTLGGTRKYYVYTDASDNFRVVRYDLAGGYQGLPFEIDITSNVKVTTGNLVVGTAGKGIDFSANGGDVLTQYDEGTWTPTDVSGAGLTFANAEGRYTRIGRMVFASFSVTFPATADTNYAAISLPYASFAMTRSSFPGAFAYTDYANPVVGFVSGSKCEFYLFGGSALRNSNLSGNNVRLTCIYEAA